MDSELDIATAELRCTIGRRIKELRHERNLDNNVRFALMCKISRPYLVHIEKGDVNITMKVLVQLAAALDVEPYQLLVPYNDGKAER